jgi:hypothetical protein
MENLLVRKLSVFYPRAIVRATLDLLRCGRQEMAYLLEPPYRLMMPTNPSLRSRTS